MDAVTVVLLAFFPIFANCQSLPTDSVPTAYNLSLTVPDLETSNTFNGSVEIYWSVKSAISELILHAQNLTVTEVTLWKYTWRKAWELENITNVANNGSHLVISLSGLISSKTLLLVVEYQGNFSTTMQGLARVWYSYQHTDKYLAVTGLEPMNAPSVFPCYDDIQYRTSFTLNVTVSKRLVVLSNVRPTSVNSTSNTTRSFYFDQYPVMPVSQLGWAIVDLSTFITRMDNNTSTLIHTRAPYPYSNHTSWACHHTARLLEAVGELTQVPYPLSKLEQIVIPEFFEGSAVSLGIISYSEEALLVTPGHTSSWDTQRVALGLARGALTQWFGGILSPLSWSHQWLLTGLAEHLQYTLAASQSEMTGWQLEEQQVVQLTQQALAADQAQHALNIDTSQDAALVMAVYDHLTKYKSGAVMRMLQKITGDVVFNTALYIYVQNNASPASSVQPEELWNILLDVSSEEKVDLDDVSVSIIMDSWVNNPGYPVVTVSWSDDGYFNISQGQGQWYVPVLYKLEKTGAVSRGWLHPGRSMQVYASSPQYILLNINQTGYFRVNYDTELWGRLSAQLTSDLSVIPHLSRAQLVDDVFGLVYLGHLTFDFLLDFTGFLAKETDYFVWHSALRQFQTLLDKLYQHSSYELLKSHMLSLMGSAIKSAGLVSRAEDSHVDKLRRVMLLQRACALGHAECLQKAVSILRSWMAGTFYDPDLNPGLLCAAVSNSSSAVWHSVWDMYSVSVFPSVRATILRALPCTTNITLLNQFLTNITDTTNPVVSSKDQTILLETLASTAFGADALLDWLMDRLYAQMPPTPSTTTTTTTTSPPTTSGSSTEATIGNQPSSDESIEMSTSGSRSLKIADQADNSSSATPRLQESVVVAILNYIVPKLTSLEQGTKIDAFVALTNTGLSNSTLEAMRKATSNIYANNDWARKNEGKITAWLEDAVMSTPAPGPSTTGPPTQGPPTSTPSPSSGATLYSSMCLCALALATQLRSYVRL